MITITPYFILTSQQHFDAWPYCVFQIFTFETYNTAELSLLETTELTLTDHELLLGIIPQSTVECFHR